MISKIMFIALVEREVNSHGVAWSFVSKNEKVRKLNRIANTWNLKIPYLSAKIKDGDREVIRKRDDQKRNLTVLEWLRLKFQLQVLKFQKDCILKFQNL